MKADLTRRLEALEQGSGPFIDDWADFMRWCAEDCPSEWRWDLKFERQMEELAEEKLKVQLPQVEPVQLVIEDDTHKIMESSSIFGSQPQIS